VTAPVYLVVDCGKVRHIQRPKGHQSWPTRSFCGARNLTSILMGTEPELPICQKCQKAWDKQAPR